MYVVHSEWLLVHSDIQAHTPPRASELFARAQRWKTRAHEYKAHSRGPQDSHIDKTIL